MPTSLPATQSASLMTGRGSYKDVLKLDNQYPTPVPSEREVIVKVRYVALNPVGYKVSFRRSQMSSYDLSGVVVNANGTAFSEGDEVFGIIPANLNMKTGHGALCQYAVVKEENLTKKPAGLSFEDVAGLPLVGLTAYGGQLEQGGLMSGQKVFINGGGTSVGRPAIGIAKEIGATVIVSCSDSSTDTCRALDREPQNVPLPAYLAEHHSAAPLDLILDLVGNSHDLFGRAETYLALNAKYISIGGSPPKGLVGMVRWAGSLVASILLPRILGGVPRTFKFWFMLPSKEGLIKLGEWAANGTIKLQIDSVHKFDKEGVIAAYDRIFSESYRQSFYRSSLELASLDLDEIQSFKICASS